MKNKNELLIRMSAIFFVVAGLLTIVPFSQSTEVSVLGYKSVCPFSPFSTIITFYIGITLFRYRTLN